MLRTMSPAFRRYEPSARAMSSTPDLPVLLGAEVEHDAVAVDHSSGSIVDGPRGRLRPAVCQGASTCVADPCTAR